MNKFFQLFGTLNTAERGRLRKFAASPYFTKNKDFEKLFDYLAKSSKITENSVFETIFAGEAFDAPRYNRLLSDATVLLLKFLEVQELLSQETPLDGTTALLEALQKRQLYRFYEAAEQTQRTELLEQPLRNSAFYTKQLALEKRTLWLARQEHKRTERSNLERVHANLDCYFIVEKLRHTCEVLNGQNVLQHVYQIEGVDLLVAWLKESAYLQEPAIQVYWQVYQLLTLQSEESFTHLKTVLAEHEARFDPDELKELYIYCTNYCIRQVNNGKEAYLNEYLEIIWRLLDNKVLFVKGELAVGDYKNTVTIGLRIGEFDKIEHFVKTYSAFLPLEHRSTAITFNLAKLHFAKAEYQKVISLLQELDYENVFYALDSRWLLLKTYYVLHEAVALDSAIRAFRVYLLRNKTISTYTKQQYLQLIILLNKIMLIPQKNTSYSSEYSSEYASNYAAKLRESIEKKTIVADKKWLIEQLDKASKAG